MTSPPYSGLLERECGAVGGGALNDGTETTETTLSCTPKGSLSQTVGLLFVLGVAEFGEEGGVETVGVVAPGLTSLRVTAEPTPWRHVTHHRRAASVGAGR